MSWGTREYIQSVPYVPHTNFKRLFIHAKVGIEDNLEQELHKIMLQW